MKKYKIVSKTDHPEVGKLYSDVGAICDLTTIFKCIAIIESNTLLMERVAGNHHGYKANSEGYYRFPLGCSYFYGVMEVTEFEIIKVNIEHINLN